MNFLLQMLNRIWSKDHFQSVCRSSAVIPILKHGRDRNVTMTYRPISLTSWTCRLHRRMVSRHLMRKLVPKNRGPQPPGRVSSALNGVDRVVLWEQHIQSEDATKHRSVTVFLTLKRRMIQCGSTELYVCCRYLLWGSSNR
jgi:hypothetical protein